MQVFLCSEGEVTGPFTSDQLHKMQANKEIGANMLYWCEGMTQWEKFRPKKDLDQISAVKKDAHFPFESSTPPPAPPWEKKNIPLRAFVVFALAACTAVFLLAWKKHTQGAQEEKQRVEELLQNEGRYANAIKQGSSYKPEEWPAAAAAAGITDTDTAQAVLGAPNLIHDNGYRWIYFDRMIHPITGMQTDMSVRFGADKKVQEFSTYP